jgi:hypothetical protein
MACRWAGASSSTHTFGSMSYTSTPHMPCGNTREQAVRTAHVLPEEKKWGRASCGYNNNMSVGFIELACDM